MSQYIAKYLFNIIAEPRIGQKLHSVLSFPLEIPSFSLSLVPAGMTRNYLRAKFKFMGKVMASPRLRFNKIHES